MTRKRCLKILRRVLALDGRDHNVTATRRDGKCVLMVTKRPLRPWPRPQLLMVGCADSWLKALMQAKAGFVQMVRP